MEISCPSNGHVYTRFSHSLTLLVPEMSDGYNDARAMRVAEIMTDFRNLQHYIAHIRVEPRPEDYYLDGYTILRSCVAEAQSVLAYPYACNLEQNPQGDPETEKSQLKAILVDAATRRFQCERIYLRALAALRWINAREQVLQGQRPHSANPQQLRLVDHQLRAELAAITDERVEYVLRAVDSAQGKWLAEDPPLETIQQNIIARHR